MRVQTHRRQLCTADQPCAGMHSVAGGTCGPARAAVQVRRQSRAGQRAGGWCRCPARAFALHLPCLTTGKDPTLSMCARLQGMDDTPRRAVPPLMNKVQAPLSATAVLTATSCASCCSLQTDTATPSSETIKQGTGGQQHGIELQSGQVTSAVRAAQTPGPLPPPWQASVPAPGRRRLPAAAVAAVSRAGTLPADRLALALAPRSVKGRVSGLQCLARSVTLGVHSSPSSCLSHQAPAATQINVRTAVVSLVLRFQ